MIHVSVKEFQTKIRAGAIMEWTQYDGNYYGTASRSLSETKGKPLLLNVDVKGSKFIKKNYPHSCLIFIRPESMSQIKQRLQARELTNAEFRRRYHEAADAMKEAKRYDHQVINQQGKINQTVAHIQSIVRSYLKKQKRGAIIDKMPKKRYHPIA